MAVDEELIDALSAKVARYIPRHKVRALEAQHQADHKGTDIENQVSHIHSHMELYEQGEGGHFVHPGPDYREYMDRGAENPADARRWNVQARTRRNWDNVAYILESMAQHGGAEQLAAVCASSRCQQLMQSPIASATCHQLQ